MSAVHLQEGEIPHSQNPMQKKLFAAHSRKSPVAGLSANNENNMPQTFSIANDKVISMTTYKSPKNESALDFFKINEQQLHNGIISNY